MDLGIISVRYARALLKIALEEHQETRVYADMQTLAKSYIEVPQFRHVMNNPMLPNEKKLLLLHTACGDDCSALTRRFLGLVLDEGREQMLQLMSTAYISLYRKEKNLITGKLTTAVPVSKDVEKKLRKMVERKANGNVEFQTKIDPDIIGGFILEYDTYRLDASVKSKLQTILRVINAYHSQVFRKYK